MSHAEEREKALWGSLSRAGIGRAYHRRSLTEIAPDELVTWATNPGERVANGEGWTLQGTAEAYDAAILLARALHIQGQSTVVLPLRRMVEWVETDYQLERLAEVRGLFITGFYERVAQPLTGWQVKGVETLLSERLDERRSVFLQTEMAFDDDCWWTPTFLRRISANNRSLTL